MRRPLLHALAVATALAGCGSDVGARNAYVAAINEARTTFDRDVGGVVGELQETSTPARTRAALGDLRDAAATFAGSLEAVRPPERVASLHRDFVAAAQAYGTELTRARERFRTGDPNVYLKARTDLQRDTAAAGQRLNRLIERINARLRP